jgi:hypothetical protein
MCRLLRFLNRLPGRDALAAWGGPPPGYRPDRRASLRHPAKGNQAVLGWWDGHGFREVAGSFRNVSLGGGLAMVGELPRNKHIWIRLEWPVKTLWRRALVLRTGRNDDGEVEVGLSFPELCDENLLDALVSGQTCLLRPYVDQEGSQRREKAS